MASHAFCLVRRRRARIKIILSVNMLKRRDDDMTEKLAGTSQKSLQWAYKSAAEIATREERKISVELGFTLHDHV